ncbi:SIMPL domain-containing protein [Rheinheimera aquimaris]|uniref:SIMPL domain-containing protein n=1 Tax=Rheinheimera aquimaris TaxID=412437 RepID=UPI000E97334E|nr:SIMPL domain-containing protein [Rheinheimera aquimaris]MCD1600484.1 SIMPL domain-containing protein [Rheinheimera aquimaris]HBN90801.1 SIMPL domain-containing protein [Rheinheimera sp.]
MKLATRISSAVLLISSSVAASPLPDFPFINVTGEAKLDVAPDKARIQFMIRHTAERADAATEAVYKQGRDLMQFLSSVGVSEADIDAAQINKEALYKDYNDRAITGYEASQPITVTLNQLTHYIDVMDYLFKQENVFSINGSFDSSQREALETKLSQQAGEDARRRADRLAGAQGVKISTVFAITEAGGWGQLAGDFGFSGNAVSFGAMRGKAEMADSGANLVLPRHITLQKSVNVIYKIKP